MRERFLLILLLFALYCTATYTQQLFDSPYTANHTNAIPPNVTVLNITFNRPLSDADYQYIRLFQPNGDKFKLIRTHTYGLVQSKVTIEPGKHILYITNGNGQFATITVYVVELNRACELQAVGRCSQLCTLSNSSQSGYVCSCLTGYNLQNDGRSCRVNAPYPVLLYTRGNTIQRYDISTRQREIFFNSTNSIDLFAYSYSKQIMYYTDRSQIASVSLSNTSLQSVQVSSGTGQISGLAYDWISNSIYYSDSQFGTIKQYHISNGVITTVLTGLSQPKSVTLLPDDPYSYLYWIQGVDIKRAHTNGSDIVTIATAVSPVAIAIDIVQLQVYWISNVNMISRSSLNGSNKEVIHVGEGSVLAGLSVFEDFVYVTDKGRNIIITINIRTNSSSSIIHPLASSGSLGDIHVVHSLLQSRSLSDIDECLVNNGGCGQGCVNTIGSYYCTCIHDYMLDEDGKTCHNTDYCNATQLMCQHGCTNSSGIARCTCNHGYALSSDGTSCHDINECVNERLCDHGCHNTDGGYTCSCRNGLFLSSDLHTCRGCSINNGGCSQLCVTSDNTYHCACKPGFKLGSDNNSCFPELSPSLFFSITQTFSNSKIVGSIYETSLSGIITALTLPLYYTNSLQTGIIYGIDTSAVSKVLYYGQTDSNNVSSLWKTTLNSNTRQLLYTNNEVGEIIWDVSYDWLNNELYWIQTNSDNGTILKGSLSTSTFNPVILLTDIDSPRGLVVNPLTNTMYWTEGGESPGISKAFTVSPYNKTRLLSLPSSSRPTGLTIDYIRQKIMWGDQQRSLIEMSTLNGLDKTLFANTPGKPPFHIAINGDRLYWTSQGQPVYSSLPLIGNESIVSLDIASISDQPKLYGITTIDDNKRPGNAYHICLLNSLQCSHYCTVNSTGQAVCTCPIGYVLLTDKRTCTSSKLCTGPGSCHGTFAGISHGSIPFFSKPGVNGQPLNSLHNPLQWMNNSITNCQVLSIAYKDLNCQTSTVTNTLLAVNGSQLVSLNSDNIAWRLLNGRIVTVTLQCSNTPTFCVNFEVSSASRAVSCGHSNGGCSHFCTTSFSSIPICSCPHGLVLGQDGYTCIDLCRPNPCTNGGTCTLSSTGRPTCNCSLTNYKGQFCNIPSTCNNAGETCATPTLHRYERGDRLTTPIISEGYCKAINSHCVGRHYCQYCECNPSLVYHYQFQQCLQPECSYTINGSISVYVTSNNYLSTVTSHNQLTHNVTGSSIPPQCTVSSIQLDTSKGWVGLPLNTLYLTNTSALKVNSSSVIDQLLGQLIRVQLSCSNDCIMLKVIGRSQTSSLSSACNECNGHFKDYIGIPIFPRPSTDNQSLTDRVLQYNSQNVQGCNTVTSITYRACNGSVYDVPSGIIYATQTRIRGRNIANTGAWDSVTGAVINATVLCQESVSFCVLFKIGEPSLPSGNSDQCSQSPCANGGHCLSLGSSGVHCTCATGFTGPNCTEIDYCRSHTCLNSGTCINGPGYATCICPKGTLPPYCIGPDDSHKGACLLGPCDNNGTCTEVGQSYQCTCPMNYTGLHCNTLDLCASNSCPANTTCFSNGTNYSCICNNGTTSGCVTSPCQSNPCMNQGTCTISDDLSAHCVCPNGYYGNHCEYEIIIGVSTCTNDTCTNGGNCSISNGGNTVCTCPADYTGQRCEVKIDNCASNPCTNGGNCTDGIETFTCTCPADYTGQKCEVKIDNCASNPCTNGGNCTDGIETFTCSCPADYTGQRCEVKIDNCASNPCTNGGNCTNGIETFTCTCPADYTGQRCEVKIDNCASNPCNGGNCTDGIETFTCTCPADYTGQRCEVKIDDCASNPCNGGNCTDGIETFTCSCPADYTGQRCEVKIDNCASNPCNGGNCTDGIETFTCSCPADYTGQRCEVKIDNCASNPCNGGNCTDGIETFTCTCPADYTGQRCEVKIDNCASNPCNGGNCTDGIETFTCTCPADYTGQRCEVKIDECASNPCTNGGTCIDGIGTFTCTCPPGYTGQNCTNDVNECATSNPCINGGTCTNREPGYTCTCTAGFIGQNCSQECPNNKYGIGCAQTCTCVNHVNCSNVDGSCTCKPGYTGTNCETPICNPACQNGGTCSGPFTCTCAETWRGRSCEERYCPGGNAYCNNRGTCVILSIFGPQTIECSCNSGYEGQRCEFQRHQLSEKETGGLSAGVVIAIILLAVLIVAAILAVWKFYPYYRKRRAQRSAALWYLDSTLVHENPAVVRTLLNRASSLDGVEGQGLDNPVYGTVSNKEPYVDSDSISVSSEEFQTSFTRYTDEQPELFIPNTVIINHRVDTGDREGTSPLPPLSKDDEHKVIKVSLNSLDKNENIYDSV